MLAGHAFHVSRILFPTRHRFPITLYVLGEKEYIQTFTIYYLHLLHSSSLFSVFLFTGKMFILELLNKFIKKYILSNILQENALRPLPRLGVAIDIDLPARIETLQVGIETTTSTGH